MLPDPRALTLDIQPLVESLAAQFPCYSDFNFISMYSWDTEGRTRLWIHQGHLVVEFPGYGDDESSFLSLLGNDGVTTVNLARHLLGHASDSGEVAGFLGLVPACVTEALLDEGDLRIVESRDNHDYIFDCVDFVHRPGQKHRESRWVLNRLESRHRLETTVHQLTDLDASTRIAVAQVADRWLDEHPDVDGAHREHAAIERILSRPPNRANVVVAEIDGKIEGFVIVERSPDGTGFVHFEKANLHIDGLSDFMWREGAKHLLDLGATTFNGEQDLGLPGLRQWKQKRRPLHLLPKYEVHPVLPSS